MAKKKPRRDTGSSNDFHDRVCSRPFKIAEPTKEQVARWEETARETQRCLNEAMHFWRQWHVERGHHLTMARWIRDHEAWLAQRSRLEKEFWDEYKAQHAIGLKEALQNERAGHKKALKDRDKFLKQAVAEERLTEQPKHDVICFPNELGRAIYGYLVNVVAPQLSPCSVSQMLSIWTQDWSKHGAENGWYKMWHKALAGEGTRSWGRRQPIPLRRKETILHRPDNADDPNAVWQVTLQVNREQPRQPIKDVVTLATQGKRLEAMRHILRHLTGDEPSLRQCGSNLIQRGNHWYIELVFREQKAQTVAVDPQKIATLEPGIHTPWVLRIDDRSINVLRKAGDIMAYRRRRMLVSRSQKSEAYKSGRGQGHGRPRVPYRFSNRLAHIKKTYNQQTVAQVLKLLAEHHVGTIVWRCPDDYNSFKTWLANAGDERQRDRGWPWFEFGRHLEHKCQPNFTYRKERWQPPKSTEQEQDGNGEQSGGEEKAGSPRKRASRAHKAS